MLDIDCDRRGAPRVSLTRPCKAYDPRSRKYVAGTTCNVSSGGMLVRLDRPLALADGDALFIAVAQKRRQVLFRSAEMLETRVVRLRPRSGGETTIGLSFSNPAQETHLPLPRAA